MPHSTSSSTSAQHSTPPPHAVCPNPDGGDCRGPLAAGSYTTISFQPKLTYRVPSGWSNLEDLPGNFLLVPPGGSLSGVNDGTSDYVGAYTSVAPDAQDCSGKPAAGVGPSASDIVAWMAQQPGLTMTGRKPARVGGLQGEVVDLKMRASWPKACKIGGTAFVPVIIGTGTSQFEHALAGVGAMRLYVLDRAGGVLAIEIDDVSGGSHLDAYSQMVSTFQFAG